MLRHLITMSIVSWAAATALAQEPAQEVTGCVSRDEAGDHFTLADVKNGTFELTGVDAQKYVGKRVEAKGTARRLRIVGGLWPTPNIAAQAGAIDPLQATIAAMPGSGTRGTEPGTATTPLVAELRVERIRTVKGRCP